MDRNGDGIINDGSELFGSAVKLADGTFAKDGFVALNSLDSTDDDVIDANDAQFDKLAVWIDGNSDGVAQAGELKSLSELSITSLNLTAVATAEINNGNTIGLVSSYTTSDGGTHALADVWLRNEENSLSDSVAKLAEALDSYSGAAAVTTNSIQSGAVESTDQVMSTDVTRLASALEQFDANGRATGSTAIGLLNSGVANQSTASKLLDDTLLNGTVAGTFSSANKG